MGGAVGVEVTGGQTQTGNSSEWMRVGVTGRQTHGKWQGVGEGGGGGAGNRQADRKWWGVSGGEGEGGSDRQTDTDRKRWGVGRGINILFVFHSVCFTPWLAHSRKQCSGWCGNVE